MKKKVSAKSEYLLRKYAQVAKAIHIPEESGSLSTSTGWHTFIEGVTSWRIR